jgi:hypothetical protein
VRETCARRRIGDANQVLAGRALNLPAGINGFALQWLVAMLAMEFKFGVIHKLHLYMRNPAVKSMEREHLKKYWSHSTAKKNRCPVLQTEWPQHF